MSTIEFNKQVLNFRSALGYFALSLTSNSEDAKDLLQDTLVKAIVYKDKFTDATNLKAWLYTIMKNTFINNYRRSVKVNQIIDNTKDLYFMNIPQHSGIAMKSRIRMLIQAQKQDEPPSGKKQDKNAMNNLGASNKGSNKISGITQNKDFGSFDT